MPSQKMMLGGHVRDHFPAERAGGNRRENIAPVSAILSACVPRIGSHGLISTGSTPSRPENGRLLRSQHGEIVVPERRGLLISEAHRNAAPPHPLTTTLISFYLEGVSNRHECIPAAAIIACRLVIMEYRIFNPSRNVCSMMKQSELQYSSRLIAAEGWVSRSARGYECSASSVSSSRSIEIASAKRLTNTACLP